MTQKIIL